MTFTYYECKGCRAALFPRRHLCFECGSASFEPRPLDRVVVAGYTEAHRAPADSPYRFLVELHAQEIDLMILAVSDFPPLPGELVRVSVSSTGLTYIER